MFYSQTSPTQRRTWLAQVSVDSQQRRAGGTPTQVFFFSTPRALVYSINNLNFVQKGELILFQCLISTYNIQFNSDLFVQNLFSYAGYGGAHL